MIKNLHIDITNDCNLRCKYCCYFNNDTNDRSNNPILKDIKKIIDQGEEVGAKLVALSGGEPTLRDDIQEIINYGQTKKILLTNGTTLFEKDKLQLLASDKLRDIRVSFDSIENCDWVCGEAGTFEKVKKTINLLKELRIPFVIYTVLGDFNISELNELYDFVISSKAYRWDMSFPIMMGRMKNSPNYVKISDKENAFIQISKIIDRYLRENPPFRLNIMKYFYSDMLNANLENFFGSDSSEHPCEYALKTLHVKTNGDVCICPGLPIIFGNVHKSSLKDIIQSESFLVFRSKKINDFKACVDCKYFNICRGGCMADALYTTGKMEDRKLSYCMYNLELVEKYVFPVLPTNFQHSLHKLIK
jgi:AdoMet-dependent heme synthase